LAANAIIARSRSDLALFLRRAFGLIVSSFIGGAAVRLTWFGDQTLPQIHDDQPRARRAALAMGFARPALSSYTTCCDTTVITVIPRSAQAHGPLRIVVHPSSV
jgi:hypothetical protein